MNKIRSLNEIILNIKLAMFDIDGTLINSLPRHIPTRKKFIKELMQKNILTNKNFDEGYKSIEISLFNFWNKCVDKDKMNCLETINNFGEEYLSQKIPTPVFKDAIELLKFIKDRKIPIGAVTSSFSPLSDYNDQILKKDWSKKFGKGVVFDGEIVNDQGHHPNIPVKPSFEAYELLIKKNKPFSLWNSNFLYWRWKKRL